MPFEFRLPDIGEGVVEGEIIKWHVKAGQEVKEDDPLVEVMTDKATVMIPSPRKGKIVQTFGEEGGIVKVGAVMVVLDTGDRSESVAVREEAVPSKSATAAVLKAAEASRGARALATPALRKMAQDMGIDINEVSGTGPGGRVTREDVLAFADEKQKPAASREATVSAPAAAISGKDEVDEIPLRGLRKKIAEKMVLSKHHAPHYTYVDEVDMTEMVKLRSVTREMATERGVKITYLPFIVKALVEGLKKYPLLNS